MESGKFSSMHVHMVSEFSCLSVNELHVSQYLYLASIVTLSKNDLPTKPSTNVCRTKFLKVCADHSFPFKISTLKKSMMPIPKDIQS